jgi:hypothetical protein
MEGGMIVPITAGDETRRVGWRALLSKGGTDFYNETHRFDFTQTKISVYVLDSLHTIPKKSEEDIAVC